MAERGHFIVAVRWENPHEAPGEATFEVIEQIGGSLDDAKLCAQSYFDRRSAPPHTRLEWVEGDGGCYYANTRTATLRIAR